MNAVGIDVPKGKSTVAILRPMGEVVQAPIDVSHDAVSMERLAYQILAGGKYQSCHGSNRTIPFIRPGLSPKWVFY